MIALSLAGMTCQEAQVDSAITPKVLEQLSEPDAICLANEGLSGVALFVDYDLDVRPKSVVDDLFDKPALQGGIPGENSTSPTRATSKPDEVAGLLHRGFGLQAFGVCV
jgi:hypothetical protein